ncbi:hypothetical protein BASA50_003988 [Batrachochytrium salamandrivorans]|uniref:Band 7 domain-containing protein n=1 Tax=Batrachochytrium salamandrivorans TaxID=1357716 RepID=A0ABQ8FGV8_9FUNG|nr:hypothetical protein BASA60_009580 [Batrachochytrium salamandrivorans]KAH6567731.1 hypothetical protein BASA62_005946 [Batrachochytrium salamandrivorans]KAH6598107.1 hypothetical protein BASA50_003988 [Batrachochytrium salamandrivorans]KAH9249015.1 hypothetical protein BASA81_013312 [Batrachochytrium salamandrivorans]KAH9272460.1 hypothetical protein BASA83_005267 [Batrachochytrium salamandrivorans]
MMIVGAAASRAALWSAGRSSLQTRLSHSLLVPYAHIGVTKFEDGIPVEQVRELNSNEKSWEFWSTSPAFYATQPTAIFVAHVPEGESWVVERAKKFSRVLHSGRHVFLPCLDKVRTVKSPHTVVSGVFAPEVSAKDGSSVDAYAVFYFKVTDAQKSTYYVDPQTNKCDSERSLASLVRSLLTSEMVKTDLSGGLTAAHKSSMAASILAAVQQKQDQLGVSVSEVEIRGAFASNVNAREKIRALNPPAPDYTTPGHDLAPDYWAEYLTPPFFEKKVYGSLKEAKTPAAVSLEWSIPSPPDFHHFHQVPRLVVAPSEDKEVAKSH